MEEQLISFKIAKLAKEKGFNIRGYNCYSEEGQLRSLNYNKNIIYHNEGVANLAATQSLLQKWLREVHDIDIYIEPIGKLKINRLYGSNIISSLVKEEDMYEEYKDKDLFSTYEEALEDALNDALKLI